MIFLLFPIVGVIALATAPSPFRDAEHVPELSARAGSMYAPQKVICPSSPLVRVANGISSDEDKYISQRSQKAATALESWLQSTGANFPTPSNYPVLGLTTSGGGLRSLLTGAGVHKALDAYDSNVSTSGLYQAMTYETGLSGGGWMLSSLAGNNWPTVSSLQKGLWNQAFVDTLAHPPHFGQVEVTLADDLLGKKGAGYEVGITDLYGRLLGYQLFYSKNGGVANTVSGLTSQSNFTTYQVPYPILTALGVPSGQLLPAFNGTQYELHPYEFGSWDAGVGAFTPMQYLGSHLVNGKPKNSKSCANGFDSMCFALGTSSSVFSALKAAGLGNSAEIKELTSPLKELSIPVNTESFFAAYPNPFYQYPHSSLTENVSSLNLVDGGDDKVDQGDPIWPMLHRSVDVLIVGANSADTSNNFPSGTEIHNTYVRAQAVGLHRMPFIPTASAFASDGLRKRASFFGCYEDDTMTIIYLPNRDITFNSGTSTFELKYSTAKTAEMISNGMQIATEAGSQDWGVCVGCAILKKSQVDLPEACSACFQKYCFRQGQTAPGGSGSGPGSRSGTGGKGPSASNTAQPSSATAAASSSPTTGAATSNVADVKLALFSLSLITIGKALLF